MVDEKIPVKKTPVKPALKAAPKGPSPAGAKKPVPRKPVPKKAASKQAKPTPKYTVTSIQPRSVPVFGPDGNEAGTIELPLAFSQVVRTDLIRRAVKAARANRQQPYGPAKDAGRRHAVSTWGKGRGVARVQRLTQGRDAAESPNNVGGGRAHPPRPEQDRGNRLNRKEAKLARIAALAAAGSREWVERRGHLLPDETELPIVLNEGWLELARTRQVKEALTALDLVADIERSGESRKVRAGRGTMRNRRYKSRRSLLLVHTGETPRAFCNLPGVEVCATRNLNTELLAPGGDPGRLVLFTEEAIEDLRGWA